MESDMTAVQNAEIVETPKVKLPPDEVHYAVMFPFDSETWISESGYSSPEEAQKIAINSRSRIGPESAIRVYRLGPPKPRMTEAEVRAIAEQMTADAKWDSMMIDILVNFVRRIGALPENET